MSEKEKPKRSTRMGFLRSCLIFSLYPLLILIVIGCGFLYWLFGGYVKPSLDPQYIPTAEYLLEHPITQGESYLNIELNIESSTHSIEFFISSMILSEFFDLRWAEIYINEQIVSRYHNFYPLEANELMISGTRFYSVSHLDNGLHIIEFRAKESLFAEPYYIQRWAIEIP